MEPKDKSEDLKYGFHDRDEHSSLISPCIEPFYKLVLDPLIIRYRLRLSNKFWYSLSFSLFSLIVYIFGIGYEVPALFFLLTALFFVTENSQLIRG
ncbi:MAG: hypothetical protein KO254_12735, partial [Methanoculleus marisnigri]|nr:hypothetical protein [Methanoculleus marisnigri]